MILALETATPICSVVLYNPKTSAIIEKRAVGRGAHSTKMLVFVHELLSEMHCTVADLSAIVVSIGPGSFTGLRIASSAIKGLAFGRDIPILTYYTTFAIAYKAIELGLEGNVHGLVDARRTHLYHQKLSIQAGKLLSYSKPEIYSIEELVNEHIQPEDHLFGTGLNRIDYLEQQKGYVANEALNEISAVQLITLMKADSKEMGLNAYIAKLGINVKELKIVYSLE